MGRGVPFLSSVFSQNLPTSSWCGGHTKILGQESLADKVGLAPGSGDPGGSPALSGREKVPCTPQLRLFSGAAAAGRAMVGWMLPSPLGEQQDPLHS